MKAPLLLMLAGLSISVVHAAEPTGTLTLACEGTQIWTSNWDEKKTGREPISMSIIIDFGARTGEYFETRPGRGWDDRRSLRISDVTEINISFKASWFEVEDKPELQRELEGRIDRVTGALEASRLGGGVLARYSLKCKPTKRMF
jgi:hypothetical protein